MTRQKNVLLLDACPDHFLVRVRGIKRWQEIIVHTAALQCHHLREPHRQELRDARDGADGYPDVISGFCHHQLRHEQTFQSRSSSSW